MAASPSSRNLAVSLRPTQAADCDAVETLERAVPRDPHLCRVALELLRKGVRWTLHRAPDPLHLTGSIETLVASDLAWQSGEGGPRAGAWDADNAVVWLPSGVALNLCGAELSPEGALQPPPPLSLRQDQRRDPRLPVQLPVQFGDALEFEGFTRDVSRSGAFIEAEVPAAQGARFLMHLALPESDEPVFLAGEVVRTCPAGLGVRFVCESEAQRAAVESAFERILDARARELSEALALV